MKLTKGKISKLYNKKKQSLKKKVNKKKSSSRNKTFRKKRNIHLARKSLKRFHYKKHRGGAEDGEGEGMPKVDETSNSVTENINQSTSETLNQSNTENVSNPVDLTTTSVGTENVEPIVDSSTTTVGTENVSNPVDLSTTSVSTENVEPIVDSSTTSMGTENIEPIVDSSTTSVGTENVEPIVDSSTTSMATENIEPIADLSTTSAETETLEQPTDLSADLSSSLNEPVVIPDLQTSSNDLGSEDLDAKVDLSSENSVPNLSSTIDDSQSQEDDLISTKTPEITVPVIEDESISNIEPVVDESVSNIEPVVDESVSNIAPVVDESVSNIEPVVDESVNNIVPVVDEIKEETQLPNKKELMNSLSNVVDYITDAVAQKVSLNVTSAQFGEKQQNGFDSINTAAEMMAKSGGKRKKTRKFKLTKKNKTKKA